MKILFFSAYSDEAIPSSLDLSQHSVSFTKGELPGLLPMVQALDPSILFLEGFPPSDEILQSLAEISKHKPKLEIVLSVHDRRRKWNSPNPDFLIQAMRNGVREMMPELNSEYIDEYLKRAFLRFNITTSTNSSGNNRVIAFVAGKGGDGKSTIAANVASALSAGHDKKVLLIDVGLPVGDLDVFFADKQKTYDLASFSEELSRLDSSLLEAMVTKIDDKLHFISTPDSAQRVVQIKPESIVPLVDIAYSDYDFVILDIGAVMDPISIHALSKADLVYVVSTLTIASLRKVNHFIQLWADLAYEPEKLSFIINKLDKTPEVSISDYEKVIGKKIEITFPRDEVTVRESMIRGGTAVKLFPKSKLASAISDWVNAWVGGKKEEKSLWHRLGIK